MKTKLVLKYRRDDKSYLCYDIVVIVMGDGRWEKNDNKIIMTSISNFNVKIIMKILRKFIAEITRS